MKRGIPTKHSKARDAWLKESKKRHARQVRERYNREAGSAAPVVITTREDILALMGLSDDEIRRHIEAIDHEIREGLINA